MVFTGHLDVARVRGGCGQGAAVFDRNVAVGIAVDASIHFLAKYRQLLQHGASDKAAVIQTMRETGKAITVNSLVLMGGFLVFMLSSFGGTASMGGLTALTLGVALFSNLLVLPALLFTFGGGLAHLMQARTVR